MSFRTAKVGGEKRRFAAADDKEAIVVHLQGCARTPAPGELPAKTKEQKADKARDEGHESLELNALFGAHATVSAGVWAAEVFAPYILSLDQGIQRAVSGQRRGSGGTWDT